MQLTALRKKAEGSAPPERKPGRRLTVRRGAALLLRFSVFQHDVGFSAFFHTQPSDDAKQECIEVIVCVVSPRSSRRTDTRCRRRATTTTCSWRRRRAC